MPAYGWQRRGSNEGRCWCEIKQLPALVPAGGNGESGGGGDVWTSKRKRREQQSHQLKTLQAGQRVMVPVQKG